MKEIKHLSGKNTAHYISNNLVIILFGFICLVEIILAKQPLAFLAEEISTRLFRNAILILSLLVPVWAGMGLNFSIVLGAMAAEIGLIVAKNYLICGSFGLAFSFLVSLPFAIVFGYFTGRLFNKTKGQEMITGMILGFFAKGVFDLVFMFLCGPIIPIRNKSLLLTNNIGLITPITLEATTKSALDKMWSMPLGTFLSACLIVAIIYQLITLFISSRRNKSWKYRRSFCITVVVTIAYFVLWHFSEKFSFALQFADVPMATGIVIIMVCLFLGYFSHTKMGSDITAVGQSNVVASSMGINVDKIRIRAVIISTIIAALGQIVFIQEIGNFATYNAHENVGTFAIAALLVGGASINKATIKQVFIGALLFHTMFIMSPIAGRNLFGNAQMGEYFRVFACYAVIAIALVLHSWKNKRAKNNL